MNKIKIPAILACVSVILFYLIGYRTSIISISAIVNTFFPCKQNFQTSYPCYAIFDFVFMGLCVGVLIVSVGVIIFRLYKAKKSAASK